MIGKAVIRNSKKSSSRLTARRNRKMFCRWSKHWLTNSTAKFFSCQCPKARNRKNISKQCSNISTISPRNSNRRLRGREFCSAVRSGADDSRRRRRRTRRFNRAGDARTRRRGTHRKFATRQRSDAHRRKNNLSRFTDSGAAVRRRRLTFDEEVCFRAGGTNRKKLSRRFSR